jgi:hypothetical protein
MQTGAPVPMIPGLSKRAVSNGALDVSTNSAATSAAIMANGAPKVPLIHPKSSPLGGTIAISSCFFPLLLTGQQKDPALAAATPSSAAPMNGVSSNPAQSPEKKKVC